MPKGLSMYVRRISKKRHGTPREFARRCRDRRMGWMAIGGPWHDHRGTRMINDARTVRRYLDALAAEGVEPFVWGYPKQGTEQQFAREMRECAGDHRRGLLDPELHSNPSRSSAKRAMARADEHARLVVVRMADEGFHTVGLSTYGSAARMRWFPLRAFLLALVEAFRGHTFAGGQTYVEDKRIDRSMADFLRIIDELGLDLIDPNIEGDGGDIELVPNFGLYDFVKRDPSQPLRGKNRKAVKKTPEGLRSHLFEFVDEHEPVDAMIGWAENFVDAKLWAELERFAIAMERGACRLPRAA